MSDKILPLPESVRSQLRSGITITSVAQCVEELVLNSLDAEATCVAVRVDLSIFRIQVVDNGKGICQEDLKLLGTRHASSKCRSIEDLNRNLTHYGFRGEALASIIDVAAIIDVTSRARSSAKTYTKLFTYGKEKSVSLAQSQRPSVGTTITIQDFMYNMPVRRKLIKEAIDIESIRMRLESFALMHPRVSFSFRNDYNNTKILQASKSNCVMATFMQLFGSERAQGLAEIHHSLNQFTISGYISTQPHVTKALQFVYVNKRVVLKTKIHKLLNELLSRSSIISNRLHPATPVLGKTSSPPKGLKLHGIYFINVKCPLSEYDICLDPRKTLVEFRDWEKLLLCIEEMVLKFICEENLVIKLDDRYRRSGREQVLDEDDSASVPHSSQALLRVFSLKRSGDPKGMQDGPVEKYGRTLCVQDNLSAVCSLPVRRTNLNKEKLDAVDDVSQEPYPKNSTLKDSETIDGSQTSSNTESQSLSSTCASSIKLHRVSQNSLNGNVNNISKSASLGETKVSNEETIKNSIADHETSSQLSQIMSMMAKHRDSVKCFQEKYTDLSIHKESQPSSSHSFCTTVTAISENKQDHSDKKSKEANTTKSALQEVKEIYNAEMKKKVTSDSCLTPVLGIKGTPSSPPPLRRSSRSLDSEETATHFTRNAIASGGIHTVGTRSLSKVLSEGMTKHQQKMKTLQNLQKFQFNRNPKDSHNKNKSKELSKKNQNSHIHEESVSDQEKGKSLLGFISKFAHTQQASKDKEDSLSQESEISMKSSLETVMASEGGGKECKLNEGRAYKNVEHHSKSQQTSFDVMTTIAEVHPLPKKAQSKEKEPPPSADDSFKFEPVLANYQPLESSPECSGNGIISLDAPVASEQVCPTVALPQTSSTPVVLPALVYPCPGVQQNEALLSLETPSDLVVLLKDSLPQFETQNGVPLSPETADKLSSGKALSLNLELNDERNSSQRSNNAANCNGKISHSVTEIDESDLTNATHIKNFDHSTQPFEVNDIEGTPQIPDPDFVGSTVRIAKTKEIVIYESQGFSPSNISDSWQGKTDDNVSKRTASHVNTSEKVISTSKNQAIQESSVEKSLQEITGNEKSQCDIESRKTVANTCSSFADSIHTKSDDYLQYRDDTHSGRNSEYTLGNEYSSNIEAYNQYAYPEVSSSVLSQPYCSPDNSKLSTNVEPLGPESPDSQKEEESLATINTLLKHKFLSSNKVDILVNNIKTDAVINPNNDTTSLLNGDPMLSPSLHFSLLTIPETSEQESSKNSELSSTMNLSRTPFLSSLSPFSSGGDESSSKQIQRNDIPHECKTQLDGETKHCLDGYQNLFEINTSIGKNMDVVLTESEAIKEVNNLDCIIQRSSNVKINAQTQLCETNSQTEENSMNCRDNTDSVNERTSLNNEIKNNENTSSDPRIADGWKESMDVNGQKIYVNLRTGNTSYVYPVAESTPEWTGSQPLGAPLLRVVLSHEPGYIPYGKDHPRQDFTLTHGFSAFKSWKCQKEEEKRANANEKQNNKSENSERDSIASNASEDLGNSTSLCKSTQVEHTIVSKHSENSQSFPGERKTKSPLDNPFTSPLSPETLNELFRDFEADNADNISVKWHEKPSLDDDECATSSVARICRLWEAPNFAMDADVLQSDPQVTGSEGTAGTNKGGAVRVYNIVHPYKFTREMLLSCKVLGQLDNKFIACSIDHTPLDTPNSKTSKLIVLFDQHAVHERIRLETIVEENYQTLESGKRVVRSSLATPPLTLGLPDNEVRIMESYSEVFIEKGLHFTKVSSSKVLFHAIPNCLVAREASEMRHRRCQTAGAIVESIVHDLCNTLQQTGGAVGTLPKPILYILNSQACRGAVKFGDELTVSQCQELITSLASCRLPFQCAHGRPSIVPVVNLTHLAKLHKKDEKPNFKKLLAAMHNHESD